MRRAPILRGPANEVAVRAPAQALRFEFQPQHTAGDGVAGDRAVGLADRAGAAQRGAYRRPGHGVPAVRALPARTGIAPGPGLRLAADPAILYRAARAGSARLLLRPVLGRADGVLDPVAAGGLRHAGLRAHLYHRSGMA